MIFLLNFDGYLYYDVIVKVPEYNDLIDLILIQQVQRDDGSTRLTRVHLGELSDQLSSV